VTAEQVKACLRLLRAGAVAQEFDDERLELFALHLRPLPYERTADAIRRYVATPGPPDRDGRPRPRFVSSVDELLAACDVNGQARPLVAEAAHRGGDVEPDFRSPCGWSLVRPGGPVPVGVLEWRALNGLLVTDDDWEALRAARERELAAGRALPAGRGELVALPARLGELKLAAQAPAARAAARAEVRELPDPLRQAVERFSRQADALAAEQRALREIRAEAEEALLAGEVPAVAVRSAAERVLRRLAEDPDEGPVGAAEVFAAACWPGLEIREFKQMPDDEDPSTVRIVLKRRAT
jgi:hypothetical protein